MRTPSIRKILREAGLLVPSTEGAIEMNAREITIHLGRDEEWNPITEEYADAQDELEDAVMSAMAKAGYSLYGKRFGYGEGRSFELTERAPVDMGDWNDPSSRWHY